MLCLVHAMVDKVHVSTACEQLSIVKVRRNCAAVLSLALLLERAVMPKSCRAPFLRLTVWEGFVHKGSVKLRFHWMQDFSVEPSPSPLQLHDKFFSCQHEALIAPAASA